MRLRIIIINKFNGVLVDQLRVGNKCLVVKESPTGSVSHDLSLLFWDLQHTAHFSEGDTTSLESGCTTSKGSMMRLLFKRRLLRIKGDPIFSVEIGAMGPGITRLSRGRGKSCFKRC